MNNIMWNTPACRRAAEGIGIALLLSIVLGGCASAGEARKDPAPAVAAVPELDSALGNYLAGRHAQRVRDYAAAARYYDRALADDPHDYELMNRALLLEVGEGHIDKAEPLASQLVAVEPGASIANLVLIDGKLKAGDFAAAEAQAQNLSHEGIHRFVAPLMLAWARAGQNQPAPALAALESLDEVKAFAPLKDFHAALILDLAGRTDEAEGYYKRVVDSTPRANWRSVEMLGNLYERTGQTEKARALYERFASENRDSDLADGALARLKRGERPPRLVTNAREGAAEALFDLASVLNQGETVDLSLIYARLAVDLKPDLPLAQMLIAELLEGQHRPEDALAVYRSIAPDSPYSWSVRQRVIADLEALGKTDEAIAELKAMAAERPKSVQPLMQLGDLLRSKSRFPEAVEAYDQAIARLGPPEPRQWNLYYSRGVALERAGQWPRAEADLKKALELQPDQPLVLNYLGYSWVDKGQHLDEALKMIEHAVQLRPNDGYVVDSLGWAYYRLGNFAEATKQLEHAIELKPSDPTINDHLGDVYWQTGRQAEARYQWRRALQFGPEEADAKNIEAKLDRGLVQPAAAAPARAQGG